MGEKAEVSASKIKTKSVLSLCTVGTCWPYFLGHVVGIMVRVWESNSPHKCTQASCDQHNVRKSWVRVTFLVRKRRKKLQKGRLEVETVPAALAANNETRSHWSQQRGKPEEQER